MEFNINRFFLLIKREMSLSGKKYLIGILAGMGVSILISLLGLLGGNIKGEQYFVTSLVFFLIGGTILASNIFKEWNKTETGYQAITLPASLLEKLTSSWVVSILLYSVMGMLAILLGGLILKTIALFGVPLEGNVYHFGRLRLVFTMHLLLGSIFFLGGITFKSNAFFKTILSCLVLLGAYSIVYFTAWYLMFSDYLVKTSSNGAVIEYTMGNVVDHKMWVTYLVHWLFVGFIGVVSYFKLKEREL